MSQLGPGQLLSQPVSDICLYLDFPSMFLDNHDAMLSFGHLHTDHLSGMIGELLLINHPPNLVIPEPGIQQLNWLPLALQPNHRNSAHHTRNSSTHLINPISPTGVIQNSSSHSSTFAADNCRLQSTRSGFCVLFPTATDGSFLR
jgi:hypothetical protein